MKFLLVDDNELSLELEKLMMESYGLTVETAKSGEEAIELAKNEEYSVIFMDIHMTGMDGFEASAKIREFNTFVPIIALSADEIAKTDVCYIESGMSGAIHKPLQLTDIENVLNEFSAVPFIEEKPRSKRKTDVIFDYDELLLMLGEEKALYQALKQFLDLHSKDCELLKGYIENNDFLSARHIMHNIVGISGILLCHQLYSASVTLHSELRREKSTSFDTFSAVWTKTMREVSEQCNRLSEKFGVASNSASWETVREDFISLCREFDINASKLFFDNINIFEKEMKEDEFAKLKKAVQGYDFIAIIDNLEEYYV